MRPRTAVLGLLLLALAATTAACTTPRKELFETYFAHMRDRGFLRTEVDPDDAPYTNRDLAEHFRRIAFYAYPSDEEHVAKPLTRWESPVRWALLGTDEDERIVGDLMQRLSMLTGLAISSASEAEANFVIMVLDEPRQRRMTDALEDAEDRRFFADFLSTIFDCGAIAGWTADEPTIRKALVYLHGDLDGLYRQLCFHEEIAQSLGLFNDDPEVRPSIFNDDDEFALLTTHDEYLLRILYDARLRSGMTEDEAMPIVREIVSDLRPAR